MTPRPALLLACMLGTLALPGRAPAQPAPGTPSAPGTDVAPGSDESLGESLGAEEAEIGRLQGQRVRRVARSQDRPAGYVIEDVAGEGAPVVGVVEQRAGALWLAGEDGALYRLAGVLARPRIAGPGYKIWVLGTVIVQRDGNVLIARRLGILAPPWRVQARAARSTIFAISAGAPTRTGGPQ